jgi:hypothetical protein
MDPGGKAAMRFKAIGQKSGFRGRFAHFAFVPKHKPLVGRFDTFYVRTVLIINHNCAYISQRSHDRRQHVFQANGCITHTQLFCTVILIAKKLFY